MKTVNLLSEFSTPSDINSIIESYFSVLKENQSGKKLEIIANSKIEEIDILLIGVLLLLKCNDDKVDITISLTKNKKNDEIYSKLNQYRQYSNTFLGKGKKTFNIIDSGIPEDESLSQPAYKLSKTFVPPLIIDEKTYKVLFERNIENPLDLTLPNNVAWVKSSERLFENVKNSLSRGLKLENIEAYLTDIGRMAFFSCLNDAKILSLYTKDGVRKNEEGLNINIQFSHIKDQKTVFELFEEIRPIFDELKEKPIIYYFIYDLLLNSKLIPSALNSNFEEMGEFKLRLNSLWQFTKELVFGLQELAKNIIHHSSKKQGLITCRLYDVNTFKKLKNISENDFTKYKDTLDKSNLLSFFDINVLDLGEKGVIETLTEFTERKSKEESVINSLFKEDLELLKSGYYDLKHLLLQKENSKTLAQQSKRSLAHCGLRMLSKLIAENQGLIRVSSYKGIVERDIAAVPETFDFSENSYIKYGTNYNIILPISENKRYEFFKQKRLTIPSGNNRAVVEGLERLFSFEVIQFANIEKINISGKHYIINIPTSNLDKKDQEQTIQKNIIDSIQSVANKHNMQGNDYAIILDFLTGGINDASPLFRLVGLIMELFPKHNFILSGISTVIYDEFLKINQEFNTPDDLYSKYNPILFLIYKEKNLQKFFFTDILWGNTEGDFQLINSIANQTSFNYYSNNQSANEENKSKSEYIKDFTGSLFFINNRYLLPVDVLLTHNESTFFEHTSKLILNQEINPEDNTDSNLRTHLPGFKISKSHFRIGSKIHISDFYYAKRFFQNSFFSNRLAFILTNQIIEFFCKNNIKIKELTLIGYGLYSELMLSLIEHYLKKQMNFNDTDINHNIFEDSESYDLVKKNERPKENVIIIIPIASTFSTAIKIEEKLISEYPTINIFPTHFNVLFVNDRHNDNLKEKFGFKKSNNSREVEVKPFYEIGVINPVTFRTEKYLIDLKTEWYGVADCSLCFPLDEKGNYDPRKERPLYETDNTSLTPSIVYDFPIARKIENRNENFVLKPEHVLYGHHVRNNGHFLYSIDTVKLFNDNREIIVSWLKEISEKADISKTLSVKHKILIISSCHYSNATFIHLINETLFSSSATIIHYDIENDYTPNFNLIYGEEIKNADYIVFIDDSLKSGKTFDGINQFIQDSLINSNGKKSKYKSIDACFFLINKSQPYTFNRIISNYANTSKMNVFSFIDLHLHTSLKTNEKSPIEIEEERYKRLFEDSCLDSLKAHFKIQVKKVSIKTNVDKPEKIDKMQNEKRKRHFYMLFATNDIHEYFAEATNRDRIEFPDFINKLINDTKLGQTGFPFEKRDGSEERKLYENAVIKVLTNHPFIQYKKIRDKVFDYVLDQLQQHMSKIEAEIVVNSFNYESFTFLKFLIRRIGLLNSNFLISVKFLNFVVNLYEDNGILKLIKNEESDKKKVLSSFHVFYVAQIKELLLRNEARGITLEKNIQEIASNHKRYNQIKRMILAENSIIISHAFQYLKTDTEWKDLKVKIIAELKKKNSSESNSIVSLGEFENNIVSIFDSKHYYDALKKLIGKLHDDNKIFKAFKTYLAIKMFFEIEGENKSKKVNSKDRSSQTPSNDSVYIPLNDKTNFIFDKVKQLFKDFSIKAGVFFIVNHGQKDGFVAYDKNKNDNKGLNAISISLEPEDDNSYKLLTEFISGQKGESELYNKSIIEYKKTTELSGQGKVKWVDMYDVNESPNEIESGMALPDESNRLILVRINKRSIEENEDIKQGVLGIYFKNNGNEITDFNLNRFLILLREDLSDFIANHHEHNEFTDWLLAEKTKQLAFLMGHGKEALKSIAYKDKDGRFKKIIENLEHLQYLVIIVGNIDEINGNGSELIKKFNQYYNLGEYEKLDQRYFKGIEEFALKIYGFEEIDYAIDSGKLKHYFTSKVVGKFQFNQEILNLILFEIYVNAKKNRWLAGDNEYRHELSTKIEIKNSVLTITIENECPFLNNDIINTMNKFNGTPIKSSYVSGTYLLNILIRRFLLGNITYDCKKVSSYHEPSRFSVIITLNEMKRSQL